MKELTHCPRLAVSWTARGIAFGPHQNGISSTRDGPERGLRVRRQGTEFLEQPEWSVAVVFSWSYPWRRSGGASRAQCASPRHPLGRTVEPMDQEEYHGAGWHALDPDKPYMVRSTDTVWHSRASLALEHAVYKFNRTECGAQACGTPTNSIEYSQPLCLNESECI